MTKRFLILAIALVCVTALGAQSSAPESGGYTPETVPNVQLADAHRFVSNPDGILSPRAEAEIDRICGDLRQRGLAEMVVLVLDRVDERSLDMFAHKVLNLWGVGKKGADNGMVISAVRSQRDIQFETGYGVEGVLPDAICKRIQTVYMVEPLRAGDFDKGVLDGVKAVYNVLTDNKEELAALAAAADGKDDKKDGARTVGLGIIGMGTLAFIVLIALLILIASRLHKKGRGGRDDFDDGPGDFGGSGTGGFGGPGAGSIIGGILGGLLGGGMGGGFGGGFGGGGFGGGFGGGRSGGGGARTGF